MIKKARKTMAKAFKDDPGFRETYVATVACFIMDRIPGYTCKVKERNALASDLIHLLFEE